MNVQTISRFSIIKGLNVVGTGDFSHPKWLREIKASLTEVDDRGLYVLKENPQKATDLPMLNIRATPELIRRVKICCAYEGMTMKDLISGAIEKELKKMGY